MSTFKMQISKVSENLHMEMDISGTQGSLMEMLDKAFNIDEDMGNLFDDVVMYWNSNPDKELRAGGILEITDDHGLKIKAEGHHGSIAKALGITMKENPDVAKLFLKAAVKRMGRHINIHKAKMN